MVLELSLCRTTVSSSEFINADASLALNAMYFEGVTLSQIITLNTQYFSNPGAIRHLQNNFQIPSNDEFSFVSITNSMGK